MPLVCIMMVSISVTPLDGHGKAQLWTTFAPSLRNHVSSLLNTVRSKALLNSFLNPIWCAMIFSLFHKPLGEFLDDSG